MLNANVPLLDVRNLVINFKTRSGTVNAVKGVDFSIRPKSVVALVGESGSGKTVTALSVGRLLPDNGTCECTGQILLKGNDVLRMNRKELQSARGKEVAYIFQDPTTSLNPVFTVGEQIAEAVRLHVPDCKDVRAEVVKALASVGIQNPGDRYNAYPHELSGGMQQRVMIAMALSCQPSLLIADEPTTALDVTIQKQIIDLLRSLRANINTSVLLITHNFGIVKDFADEVLVMYQGKIVERGSTHEVLNHPQHPYTQALIDCIPRLGQRLHRLKTIDYKKIEAYSTR